MKQTGRGLSDSKISEIKKIALEEFTLNGYGGTSTNVIIKRAGISKGSLFNYFGSKKELYFHLIREYNGPLLEKLKGLFAAMPGDYIERMLWITEGYLDAFAEDPEGFRFLMTLTDEDNSKLAYEFYLEFMPEAMEVQKQLLSGIDTAKLRVDEAALNKITGWVFQEIKRAVFSTEGAASRPEDFRSAFMNELNGMLDILKHGLYKQ